VLGTKTLTRLLQYGVATISRLLKIIRLLRRISSLLQDSFAKETLARLLQISCRIKSLSVCT